MLLQHEHVVFIISYRWYTLGQHSAAQLLKKSVASCLSEAERCRLSSIAIPAISCGVFGGKPDQSAKLIVEAVKEYFAINRTSSLKRVILYL